VKLPLPSLEEIRAEMARRRLLDFVLFTFPGYEAGWFAREVCEALDWFLGEVEAKRSPRLILEAPPRHGKSEIVSRRFPAFAFGRSPDLSIIAASYGADLASRMNRDVQRVIDSELYHAVFPTTALSGSNIRTVSGTALRNSDIFEIVGRRGCYRSAGVGGGITGMGADVLIVDDPIKDAEQAESAVYRAKVWEWFTSTAYTRLAPGGGVLLIMTRWHEDDLAGRLQDLARRGEGETYRVLRFPAVAEHDEAHRKEGEALHPERYPLDQLERIRMAVGSRVWASLYQQRPAAAEGQIFKREHWRDFAPVSDDPRALVQALGITRVIQSWDTAFKKGQDNDYSVGLTIGAAPARYYLLDLWRSKVEFPELKRAVVAQAAKWTPAAVLVEDAAAGQSLLQELRRDTVLPLVPVKPDKDKVSRAHAITAVFEAGLCSLPVGASWVADFVDELASFPAAAHDDQVDTFTQGLHYLTQGGGARGLLDFMQAQAQAQAEQDAQGGAA